MEALLPIIGCEGARSFLLASDMLSERLKLKRILRLFTKICTKKNQVNIFSALDLTSRRRKRRRERPIFYFPNAFSAKQYLRGMKGGEAGGGGGGIFGDRATDRPPAAFGGKTRRKP
jgi:hypothetical protein